MRGVVEEGGDRVKLALGERVELVVVADGAAGGESEPDLGDGFGAVAGVEDEVFLGDGAALVGGHVAAVEAGGDFLVEGGVGEEVAGELFDGELVEGLVAVEGVDDPVAVGPHFAEVVEVEAVGIGVAGGVEPVAGAVLAPGGGFEEAVDVALVGVGRWSSTKAWTMLGVGGRPVRSRAARRARVWRSASGAGVRPAASSRLRMKRSIGF